MRLRKYWMLTTLVSMVLIFLSGNVLAYNMVEYFPLNQGDEWTFLCTMNVVGGETEGKYGPMLFTQVVNGTEIVNEVETVKLENRMPGFPTPDYDCYVVDSEGIILFKHHWINYADVIFVVDQGVLVLPAQFSLGEVNQQPYSLTAYDSDGNIHSMGTGNFTCSIEAVEDVSIPAGTFEDCLKIFDLILSQANDGSTFSRESTYWLAPNVGIVKMSLTDNWYSSEEGEVSVTMTFELMRATVDGIHYGRCPAILVLGEDDRDDDLNTLRKFRDEVLSKTTEGRQIIQLYYQLGPAVVKAMAKDKELKQEIKEMIDRILPLLR